MKLKSSFLVLTALITLTITSQTNNSLEGIWEMRGYGWIFSIDNDEITTYDITSMSCGESASYPASMLSSFSIDGDVLTTKVGLSTYVLDRLDKMPGLCVNTLSRKQKKNPIYNFEVLWHTFNEQYAYFDLRNTDWDALYAKYGPLVKEKTSEVELYRILNKMLEEIGDGHVGLEAPDKIMEKAIDPDDDQEDVSFKDLWMAIAHHYVKDLKTHNYTKSVWGKINDKVGYLQVNDMVAQAHYGITPNMPKEKAQELYMKAVATSENHMLDETEGMRTTMQNVLRDLAGVDHIILDVRFNGGGFDTVSYEIIRAFTSQPFIAFQKYARQGEGTTEPYLYEVQPAEHTFTGNVHILQSHFSGSATETMLLASMQMPNVTRVGSRSEGILSDALEKVLPNGWTFTMSNEAYVTPEGINYEQEGIPVDKALHYEQEASAFTHQLQSDLQNGGDKAIEMILKKVNR